jgi:hypothetical protein
MIFFCVSQNDSNAYFLKLVERPNPNPSQESRGSIQRTTKDNFYNVNPPCPFLLQNLNSGSHKQQKNNNNEMPTTRHLATKSYGQSALLLHF